MKNLEEKISELAECLKYPILPKKVKKARYIASELDSILKHGEKQAVKNLFFEKLLDYKEKNVHYARSSLTTITDNIIYLAKLGIKDLNKITKRFLPALVHKEKKLKSRVEYLKSLGVKEKNIGKVVTRLPQVFGISIDRKMQPRVDYLKSIGVKEEDIGKVVTKLPAVLEYDIEKTMQQRVDYLKSIDIKEEDIGKVVTRAPSLLKSDIKKTMQPRIDYLKSIGVKEEDIGKVVKMLPSVLECSIEKNLKPTYEFLARKMNVDSADITNTPSLLSYSLDKRIKPRYEFLKQKGFEGKFKATTILSSSDENFAIKRAKSTLKEYQQFKEKYIANLK